MRRTLVLDLDGTLVDSLPDLQASANRVLGACGLAPFTREEVVPMIGDGATALVGRLLAARDQVVDGAGLAVWLAAFLDDYMAHPAALTRPYPGAEAALDAFAGAGWGLAICTNKPGAAARQLLEGLGLASRFAAVVGGDDLSVRKPDPAHVWATLRAAGGEGAGAVMLGDHHNDMAAARGAGIAAVFAGWGYGAAAMAGDAPVAADFGAVTRLLLG